MDENTSAHFSYCHIIALTRKSHGTDPAHAPAPCAEQRGMGSRGLQKPRGTPPAKQGQAAACALPRWGEGDSKENFWRSASAETDACSHTHDMKDTPRSKSNLLTAMETSFSPIMYQMRILPCPHKAVITSLLCCPFLFKWRPPCPVRASSPRTGLSSVRSRQSSWQVPLCSTRGLKHSAPCPQAHMHHFW